jgi:hypothetical protein
MSHTKWGSVRATTGLRLADVGTTCYYEARIESPGATKVGWATERCRLAEHKGIGDDKWVSLSPALLLSPPPLNVSSAAPCERLTPQGATAQAQLGMGQLPVLRVARWQPVIPQRCPALATGACRRASAEDEPNLCSP